MTAVFLTVFLIAGAAALLVWAVRTMLTHHCPYCAAAGQGEGMLIPVIPGRIWWCVSCNNTPSHREVIDGRVIESDDEESLGEDVAEAEIDLVDEPEPPRL